MMQFIIALLISMGAFGFSTITKAPTKKANINKEQQKYSPNDNAPTLNILEEDLGEV